MDGLHFDRLTQRFGLPGSRRAMVRGLLAGVVAGAGITGLSPAEPAVAAQCQQAGRKCRQATQCCSQRCGRKPCPRGRRGKACRQAKRRVCLPGVTGRTCRQPRDCQSGVCSCGAAGDRVCWAPSWSQNFDRNLNGWFDLQSRPGAGPAGVLKPASHSMRRRPASNIPIPPASGATVGQIFGPVNALENNAISALTTWGGYKQTLPAGGYTVSLAVYIDPAVVPANPDARFVFAVSGSDPDTCLPTGPIYFRAGNQASNPAFFCLSIMDSDPTGPPCTAPYVVSISRSLASRGWYTFVAEFFASTATNQMMARAYFRSPEGGATLPQTFVIPGGYGGNHSAWFPFIAGYDAVYIDNAVRTSGGVSPS